MSSPKSHSGDFQPHDDAFPSGRLDPYKLYATQHDYYKLVCTFSYFNILTIVNFVKLNIKKNASSDEIAASLSTTLDRVSLMIRSPGHILTGLIVQ